MPRICAHCERKIKGERYVRSSHSRAYYHFPGECSPRGVEERKRSGRGMTRPDKPAPSPEKEVKRRVKRRG